MCACPCHIAGLKSYLRKDYDNLITMDLICHGVPSQPYFRDYVKDLLSRKAKRVLQLSVSGISRKLVVKPYILHLQRRMYM